MVDALGKPGIVPSSPKYLASLRNYQINVYAEIIRGEKPIDYFETFRKEWLRRGGEQMTREANEIFKVKQAVYARIDKMRAEMGD
jgi:putative aldouronate transport system substrate-binding protein